MEMNEKKKSKKLFKIIGNIATIVALVLVVWKVFSMDMDFSMLTSLEAWIAIFSISVLYGLIIIVYGWPWSNYVKMITKVKLKYSSVAYVMAKSNLLKYIPGNVFQYVGRNELAIEKDLKHSEVGMATMFDVVTNLMAAAILGNIFYLEGFLKVIEALGSKIALVLLVAIVAIILIVCIIYLKKKDIIFKYLGLLKSKSNIKTCLLNFLFYMINMFINALLFVITLIFILDINMSFSEMYVLMGAFMLSWIVGFVVPGAPGGIGIREFVITLLIPNGINIEIILVGMVVYRFINIIGDVLGFLFAGIIKRVCDFKDKKGEIVR